MSKQNIGLIGLAVMGQNLVLNLESRGYSVAAYNRTSARTDEFVAGKARGKNIIGTYTIKELTDSLEKPRKIILMVKAGEPVDDNIKDLTPLLEKGDLIIDGGNSFFKDTIRRNKELAEKGIYYIGTGVSGGEEGALKGPAIMPGGQIEAYRMVEKIFKDIAGKAEDGTPCVSFIGHSGAGHFVKMVHNGIEYADMQLIGECVWVFKNALGLDSKQISEIMFSWNSKNDLLKSYLIEITGETLKEVDKTFTSSDMASSYLVDKIADITGMKGTGTWTVQSALELLAPVPTIAAAVFSREMSQDKNLRLKMSEKLKFQNMENLSGIKTELKKEDLVDIAHDSLYIAKVASYAQGFALLDAASKKYDFNLIPAEIARGWRAGCIIRAQFLNDITSEFMSNPNLENLIAAPKFYKFINQNLYKLAQFIDMAHCNGVPAMAMSSSYDYIIQLAAPLMISAQVAAIQRDYFGAHGYGRLEENGFDVIKKPEGPPREFHTEWMEEGHPEIER
jgi:6-phosphogluconate dehydrogenase